MEGKPAAGYNIRQSTVFLQKPVEIQVIITYHKFNINIRSLDRKDAKVVPIIAMTANAFTEDKLKAKEAGMDEHIAKPVDVKLLVKVISRLVENSFWGIRNEKEKME